MCRAHQELRFDTLRVKKKDEKRESYGQNYEKNGPTLSQILLSVVDKTAYLEGSVCTWILANRQQLGP